MRQTNKCSIETIQRILDKFFYDPDSVERRERIAQEEDWSWTAIDNWTWDCWTENFKTEFAARFWLANRAYDAEYIRWY